MKRPLMIGIGGSHSGSGKTFLVSRILRFYTQSAGLQSLMPPLRWGAVKYTGGGPSARMITDRSKLMEKGKDTWHMFTSGALEVVWVKSSREHLGSILPQALARLSGLDVIIVEGNGAIEFLNPDIVIFIFGKNKKEWKPDVAEIASRADIILYEPGTRLPEYAASITLYQKGLSDREHADFFRMLSGIIDERRTERGNGEDGS